MIHKGTVEMLRQFKQTLLNESSYESVHPNNAVHASAKTVIDFNFTFSPTMKQVPSKNVQFKAFYEYVVLDVMTRIKSHTECPNLASNRSC